MKIRPLLAALALGVLPVSAAHAVGVSITIAPPPLVAYEQPLCPTEGYIWTPGYWAYDDIANDYYWVQGVWVAPPRVGYLWTPGYWGFGDGFYAFHSGYWGPTVGFYGGINYGYGYGGYGYYGGRWDGRVFRYNTAVTRVNVTNIHNTYVDNNFRARTDSRASFNGQGGVVAKADARERAAANASHAHATGAQTAALRDARSTHNPQAQRQTADRAQNRRVTPDGRAAGNRRDARISRNSNASADNSRGNRRAARDTVSRGSGSGRNRNAVSHGNGGGRGRNRASFNPGGGGRSRGPQPARQPRTQSRGGGGAKNDGRRH